MKKLLIMLVAVMMFTSCADLGLFHRRVRESSEVSIDTVPFVILKSYSQKYPGITTEKWFKVNNNMYAVRFDLNGKKTYAFFSNAGLFIDDDDIDQYDYDQDDDFMDGWDYFDYDIKD
jgi:hypothetical protein